MAEIEYPELLLKAFKAFKSKGIDVYLIGPRARDLALEQDISQHHSFDLTVDAPFSEIESIMFEAFKVGAEPVNEDRPRIITFKVPVEDDVITFNIGPFRSYLPPLKSLRNHHLHGIILDLATREITIQAFGYDIDGNLIDPFQGVEDLKNRIIRPVFPVQNLFKESGGWLLKMARYISRYGFDPATDAFNMAYLDAVNIMDVPRDVWRKEMDKLLGDRYPSKGLTFLAQTRVLGYILPEVYCLYRDSLENKTEEHKDIWEHTLQVIEKCPGDPVLRWTALIHDVGKVWTKQKDADGQVHFLKHEEVSAMLFDGIWRRFGMSEEVGKKIWFLVKNHSRINLYREEWSDSAVRRLMREMGDYLDDLVEFSKCDLTSKREKRVQMIRSLLTELQIRIRELREEEATKNPLPKGLGNEIMKEFGLEPGPHIGKIRNKLVELIESNKLEGFKEIDYYIDYLREHPELIEEFS